MKALGTDFVLYEVSDIDRSIAFFRDTLGLELEFQTEDFPWPSSAPLPLPSPCSTPKSSAPKHPIPK